MCCLVRFYAARKSTILFAKHAAGRQLAFCGLHPTNGTSQWYPPQVRRLHIWISDTDWNIKRTRNVAATHHDRPQTLLYTFRTKRTDYVLSQKPQSRTLIHFIDHSHTEWLDASSTACVCVCAERPRDDPMYKVIYFSCVRSSTLTTYYTSIYKCIRILPRTLRRRLPPKSVQDVRAWWENQYGRIVLI